MITVFDTKGIVFTPAELKVFETWLRDRDAAERARQRAAPRPPTCELIRDFRALVKLTDEQGAQLIQVGDR